MVSKRDLEDKLDDIEHMASVADFRSDMNSEKIEELQSKILSLVEELALIKEYLGVRIRESKYIEEIKTDEQSDDHSL